MSKLYETKPANSHLKLEVPTEDSNLMVSLGISKDRLLKLIIKLASTIEDSQHSKNMRVVDLLYTVSLVAETPAELAVLSYEVGRFQDLAQLKSMLGI